MIPQTSRLLALSLSLLALSLGIAAPAAAQAPSPAAPSPAEALRRKAAAAAELEKGRQLRAEACAGYAKSQALDGNAVQVVLRLADCKRLDGELARAAALVERTLALATAKKPPRRATDEPRAAALARIAAERWAQACGAFHQSLQGDVTVDAALQVATCQIAATQLREARDLLTSVMPIVPTLPPPMAKRLQAVVTAIYEELQRLQPYLTVVTLPGDAEVLTVDGALAGVGQPLALDPGPHTIAVRSKAPSSESRTPRPLTFEVTLALSERRMISVPAERDKLAGAEFSTGAELLQRACQDLERKQRTPQLSSQVLQRLALCKRLFAQHGEADALWKELAARPVGHAPPQGESIALLDADEQMGKACRHFEASLALDFDLATELAVVGCQLRENKRSPVRARLERLLAPPSPLASPVDELGHTQAELARALLADLDRLQPRLRVEPAAGFRGKITVNGTAIAPSASVPIDPGHYIILQVPERGPRIVHEVVFADRERVVLKHNLRCNALGNECVNPEMRVPVPRAPRAQRPPGS